MGLLNNVPKILPGKEKNKIYWIIKCLRVTIMNPIPDLYSLFVLDQNNMNLNLMRKTITLTLQYSEY